jgi:glycosyltransferase involved in cell wall biosynthesis
VEPLKIFGWASDHSGCGNYRIGLPMWALSRFGHDATAFSQLNVDPPEDLDVLVGQLVVSRERTAVWRALIERPNRSYAAIYEIDDDIWNLRLTGMQNGFFTEELGELAKENIAMADAVTVTNDHLAEVVSVYNKNVYVIPNCFDAAILEHERPVAEKLTVGWAGGSSHVSDYLAVEKDLKTFFRRNPQVDSHFIGVNHGAAVGRPDTRFTPWAPNLVDYIRNLDFDIGIAPLAWHAFNRSKSDLKFMEYASLGIAVVASDFGPYAASIQHRVTGMKVRYPHEWSKYLYELSNDHALRAEISANAKAWAASRTIQANFWRWEDVYREVLGKVTVPA